MSINLKQLAGIATILDGANPTVKAIATDIAEEIASLAEGAPVPVIPGLPTITDPKIAAVIAFFEELVKMDAAIAELFKPAETSVTKDQATGEQQQNQSSPQ